MKVLYVVGTNLTKNTSANMSHNAYVQGLLENGCQVDIVMADDSWGEHDNALPYWENARYFEYNSKSFVDKMRRSANKTILKDAQNETFAITNERLNLITKCKVIIRLILKKAFYAVFPNDPIYPLEKVWLKKAANFKNDKTYDLVISNSSPAASHKLVTLLNRKKYITFRRWIQIWEDPWYFDLYGGHSNKIKEEEHRLLREADEIFYVSPLTLDYQRKHYSDCASKMHFIPLPFLRFGESEKLNSEKDIFGYFGDYYSHTRNIEPFYNVMRDLKCKAFIYGNSDLTLEPTGNLEISERVTLEKLSLVQDKTGILVHLCNLRGGQIPGKIYHYSATEKPILFILDGTKDECERIRSFFAKFNRYCFCENTEESIKKAVYEITKNYDEYCRNEVREFSPENVVRQFL